MVVVSTGALVVDASEAGADSLTDDKSTEITSSGAFCLA